MLPAGNSPFFRVIVILLLFLTSQCTSPEHNNMDDLSSYFLREKDTLSKPVIYQVLPRLFGNKQSGHVLYGTIEENGVGKFDDFTGQALDSLKALGITWIWYTGVIEHAELTDYRAYGIPLDDADVVKGRAGSPYAIKDYYDVDPDLAVNVRDRMKEFQALVDRTHSHGIKVIIDFVPNHVARGYHSNVKPDSVRDLGEDDDITKSFSINNNFYYLPGTKFRVPKGYIPLGSLPFPNKDGKFHEVPAKATGNNVFKAQPDINDWFETVKLNYGVDFGDHEKTYFNPIPSTWKKMRDILLFWAEKGVDGFRCDIAEMVPVEFWHWVIPQVKAKNKDLVFIAEIYNPARYKDFINTGGFDYLYDKVQLYDTLRHIVEGKGKVENITPVWKSLAGINDRMVRFLENHDEQRIASPYFARNPFKALSAMTVTATLYKGPVMIYCGQEVGEPAAGASGFSGNDGRTSIFDYWSMPEFQKWTNGGKFDGGLLSPEQKKIRNFYKALLNLCTSQDAIAHGDFFDLYDWNRSSGKNDNPDVYYYLRLSDKQTLLIVANFDEKNPADLSFDLPGTIGPYTAVHERQMSNKDLMGNSTLLKINKKTRDIFHGDVKVPAGGSLIFNL